MSSPPNSSRRTGSHRGSPYHVPTAPSSLRKSIRVGLDHPSPVQHEEDTLTPLSSTLLGTSTFSAEPEQLPSPSSSHGMRGALVDPSRREADARTRLLAEYHRGSVCGANNCNHGTFSPHILPRDSTSSNVSTIDGCGGRYGGGLDDGGSEARDKTQGWLGAIFAAALFGGSGSNSSMSTTKRLAKKHGVKNRRIM